MSSEQKNQFDTADRAWLSGGGWQAEEAKRFKQGLMSKRTLRRSPERQRLSEKADEVHPFSPKLSKRALQLKYGADSKGKTQEQLAAELHETHTVRLPTAVRIPWMACAMTVH